LQPRFEVLEDRLAPATFAVNTTDDTPEARPGSGTALDPFGHVSLRSAIMEADALGGANTITVPAGTYRLTLASTLGDLSITDGLTLSGVGADAVTVDALGVSRVFEVSLSAPVTLSGLTITGGKVVGHGGGILNTGNLTLRDCAIDGNTATGMDGGSAAAGGQPHDPGTVSGLGGGIYSNGALTVVNCTLSHNKAMGGNGASAPQGGGGGGGGGLGGGVFNDGGSVEVLNSTLFGNLALGGNGGDAGDGSNGQGGGGGGFGGAGGNNTEGVDATQIGGGGGGSGRSGALGGGGGNGFLGGGGGGGEPGYQGGQGSSGGFGGGGSGGGGSGSNGPSGAGGGGGALGGGICNVLSGTLTIFNSTITGNSAIGGNPGNGSGGTAATAGYGAGGGVAAIALNGAFPTTVVQDTIIAGNMVDANPPSIAGIPTPDVLSHPDGMFDSHGSNFIGIEERKSGFGFGTAGKTDQVGTGTNPLDPKLGPLQDNGGPTKTAAPLPGSPVIDQGLAAGDVTTDQRGVPRTDEVETASDIGAVETGPAAPRAATTTTLGASPNPAVAGTPVTLTAAVTANAPGAAAPTGSVTFLEVYVDTYDVLGTVPLDSSGRASLSVPFSVPRDHNLVAFYDGDGNFAGSSSTRLDLAVKQPVSDVTGLVMVRQGKRRRHGHRVTQQVTLVNASPRLLEGPVSLVLTGVGRKVRLLNQTGIAVRHGKVPYIDVVPDGHYVKPGDAVEVVLQFQVRGKGGLDWTPLVLAGTGPR
jgi:hypothetical protein